MPYPMCMVQATLCRFLVTILAEDKDAEVEIKRKRGRLEGNRPRRCVVLFRSRATNNVFMERALVTLG
jgi:hypothetical protein